jgi:hypothetical protein
MRETQQASCAEASDGSGPKQALSALVRLLARAAARAQAGPSNVHVCKHPKSKHIPHNEEQNDDQKQLCRDADR